MTVPTANGAPLSARMSCAVYRVDGGRLNPITVAGPGDDLLLVVRVWPGPATELTVELYRGDQVRDRRRLLLPASAGPRVVPLRLRWGDRPGGSSRLTCRALLDGQPEAQCVVILAGAVDAQGRLAPGTAEAPESAATRLACTQALRALCDEPNLPARAKSGPRGAYSRGPARCRSSPLQPTPNGEKNHDRIDPSGTVD